MPRQSKKHGQGKDITQRYLADDLDEDRIDKKQRFSQRNKHSQANKTLRTAEMRAAEQLDEIDWQALPMGEVIQVFSRYSEVEMEGKTYLAVIRKTLAKVRDTQQIVGDKVRLRVVDVENNEAVIEQISPRRTVLTRSDSFNIAEQHPIVANADQMLIVASLLKPRVKWGLVDRMIVAAKSGDLAPIVCLNKVDLLDSSDDGRAEMDHYASMGIATVRTSVERGEGIDQIRDLLRNKTTVLAGHSGVGKSSLINVIEPTLNLRTTAVSNYNDKGRHTTTSARRFPLGIGGFVVDTPGVKMFGLWNTTHERLLELFPDIADKTAPAWRVESFERIKESLVET